MLVVNFFLFRVMLPGDPARALGRGRFKTPEALAEFKAQYGLDQPLPQQFLTYLQTTLTRRPRGLAALQGAGLRADPRPALAHACCWSGTSVLLAMLIGVYLGMITAWNRGRTVDRVWTPTTLVLYSMPEWWLGLLLIVTFAVGIGPFPGIFPVFGLSSDDVDPTSLAGVLDVAWHLTLPVITLTLAYLADYTLIMRSSLLDELGEDYLVTARAKGLRDVDVRRRHAVPNALLPTATIATLNLGFVLSGAITVETIFSIPGLGLLSTEALTIPDYPVLQGTFLVASGAVLLANLGANLLYGVLDPRVRT